MQKELPKYLAPRDKNNANNKEYKYIPKKIFQTYETNQVSSGMYDAASTWIDKNPDWEYHFFDDNDCRNFIKDNLPKKVLVAYDTLVPGAFKADLFRYCVLYIYGGVYVDSKAELLVSLNDVIPSDVEFLSVKDRSGDMQDPFGSYILQAFICSKRKHLFLEKVINLIVENAEIGYYGVEPISPTGPGAIGKAINLALGRREGHPHLLGKNNIVGFEYTLWNNVEKYVICDSFDKLVFRYEYFNYRKDLLGGGGSRDNNIARSYRYCWCFDKVYANHKVLRPKYNGFFLKQFKRDRYKSVRMLLKFSNDITVINKILFSYMREEGVLGFLRIVPLHIKYQYIYPLFRFLGLKR